MWVCPAGACEGAQSPQLWEDLHPRALEVGAPAGRVWRPGSAFPGCWPRDGAEASAPPPPLKGTCHGFMVLHVGSPGFPKSVSLGRVALHVVAASFPGRLDREHLTLPGAGHPAAPAAGVKSSGALGK